MVFFKLDFSTGKYLINRNYGLPSIISNECKYWGKTNYPYRGHNLPAYRRESRDRNGKPIFACLWFKNGEQHRDNGLPALEYSDGHGNQYWVNGKKHRDNGLPAVDYRHSYDNQYWVNGIRIYKNTVS
jgi:hypothetical protein